jgi:phage terminase large subunit-like protein
MMTPEFTTSCTDWETRIVAGDSLITSPPLYASEAEAGLAIMKQLRIVDAPGSPTLGEAGAPWVFDLAAAFFGSYDPDSGRRQIQDFFISLSKKNSKSTLASALMLTVLIRNWRQSAQFLILSPTQEVSMNAFAPCRDMVKHDEELSELLHVQEHLKTITHRGTGATLKIVTADQNTVGGVKGVGVLVDELHLLGKNPHAENMLREATGGLASRPEGFVIYLTTQSDQPPAGVFKQKLQYARDVRDGVIKDNRFLPVLYEFPKAMLDAGQHRLKENFYITNPNMGYSVDPEYLEREFDKAQAAGEESTLGFLSKHLNCEIGLALRSDRWAGADFWQEQSDTTITLDSMLDRCEVIDVGIDGGGLNDLLGLSLVGREKETGDWLVWCRAWGHPSALQRNLKESSRFQDFKKDGDMSLVLKIGEDVTEVCDIVERVYDSGLLDKIGVDPVGIGAIFDELVARSIPEDKIVGISQGWKLGGAIKTTERRLAEGKLKHAEQPLMSWCVSNCRVEPRANSILITKQASGSAKIDPVMALFNAVSLMALNPPAAHKKFQLLFL